MVTRFRFICFLCLFASICAAAAGKKPAPYLFRIIDHGKIGYIDSAGHVTIPPRFPSANDFSEGLAAARVNGSYGFIDPAGKFAITPRYDYATFFSEGLAIVFTDGQPFYIDRSGRKPLQCNYKFITPYTAMSMREVSTPASFGENRAIILPVSWTHTTTSL